MLVFVKINRLNISYRMVNALFVHKASTRKIKFVTSVQKEEYTITQRKNVFVIKQIMNSGIWKNVLSVIILSIGISLI